MRNATILVVNLRGVATETIKNIVLAGIGRLIIWDCEDVAAEDLGVGFFFRDEDVGRKVCSASSYCCLTSLTASGFKFKPPPLVFGLFVSLFHPCRPGLHRHAEAHGCDLFCFVLQRVDAAKARIESLNPLVTVETMTSRAALEREEFDALVQGVDLVCITDSDRDFLVSRWALPNSSSSHWFTR